MVKEPNNQSRIFANAGPDMRLFASEEAFFDGSASSGKDLRFCWDFDESDATQNDAFGKTATHIYRKPGAYVARLTVIDQSHNVSSDSCSVEVLTPPSQGLKLVDRFPKGYMGQVYHSGNRFTCHLTQSVAWYGRLDNCAGKEITLKIYGYGKHVPAPPAITTRSSVRTFSQSFKALFCHSLLDGEWGVLNHATYRYHAPSESMEITFKPHRDPFYIAWSLIYTPHQLRRYLGRIYLADSVQIQAIGQSVEDRPIYMATITSGQQDQPDKPALWIIAQQHGFEMGGGPISEGIINFLLSDDPLARDARDNLTWKIVPMVNPDAMSHPWFRYNSHGIDLHTNWDAFHDGSGHDAPDPEPEVKAVKNAVQEWIANGRKIVAGFDIHNLPPSETGIQLLIPPSKTRAQTEMSRNLARLLSPGNFPHAVETISKPHPRGSFCRWLHSTARGSSAFMLSVGLGGYGSQTEPKKYPALPQNFRHLGEFLAKTIYTAYSKRKT